MIIGDAPEVDFHLDSQIDASLAKGFGQARERVQSILFAIDYGRISTQLVNAGGFYAFVVKGLGRPAGLAAGYVATLGYNFFVVEASGSPADVRADASRRGRCHRRWPWHSPR